MKIIRNDQLGTLTLVPVEVGEEENIWTILATIKPEDKMVYGGCTNRRKGFRKVHLHIGKIEFILSGSTEEDKHEVGRIRDFCFFGSSGLIFMSEASVDGKRAIVTTGRRCQLCNEGMINLAGCECGVCDDCAKKCEHEYFRGIIHGGGLDIGVGDVCKKCGRANPNDTVADNQTPQERHDALEKEFNIEVVCIP